MTRKEIKSDGAVAVGPYSQAIDAGDFVFLSGQTPIDQNTGKLLVGDIAAQTNQCFKNLFNVLQAAGLTHDNVIKVNVFLTEMKNFDAMNSVYKQHFSTPFPARTTIGVRELPLGAEVEIEMIAKR